MWIVSQYHTCWYPVGIRRQGISRYDIDLRCCIITVLLLQGLISASTLLEPLGIVMLPFLYVETSMCKFYGILYMKLTQTPSSHWNKNYSTPHPFPKYRIVSDTLQPPEHRCCCRAHGHSGHSIHIWIMTFGNGFPMYVSIHHNAEKSDIHCPGNKTNPNQLTHKLKYYIHFLKRI